jgi:hypothetical protein
MPTTAPTADRIARIREKARAGGKRFGSPLSEERVLAFEQAHGITLPEAFRAFLIHIGNGGTGPTEYNWPSLGQAADDMSPQEAQVWGELPYVSRPFPFTRRWVWEGGDTSDEGDVEQAQYGTICVGNDGCGQYWFVVVTGPERGNVWMICGEGMQHPTPKRDFLQWIEDWLDGTTDWWA